MNFRSKNHFKRILVLSLCVVMVLSTGIFSFAADDAQWSWNYPKASVSVNNGDGTRNVTVTCTNAGANIGEILGADQPAGGMYGRYDGGIKLWTTDANENPDRYLSNLAYLWCKYNESPSATTSKFPATQQELSPHQYTLNPVGGTSTGQYGRTLAGSGPNTVNKTAVAEYGGLPTVLYSRADIICGSTVANYEEYLELMHSDEWKNSDYYMPGDENYNPIFVEIGTGTMSQRINAMKDVAAAMNEVIENSNGTIVARYGDPEVIANDIEKTVFGTYFYIKSLIDAGKIEKQKATWIAAKDTTTNTYKCTYYGMEICHEFFGDIFDGPAEKYNANASLDNVEYTISDLAKMDFILCGRNQKQNLLKDFAEAGYKKDEIPTLMEDMNHTGFDAGWGMGGASTTWALAYPYCWVYAYADDLADINKAANPTAVYRFIQEKFCHIKASSSASVAAASLEKMWNQLSDIDTVPDKTNYYFNKMGIESFITEGVDYAVSNKETINGAYECWWDPFYQCSTFADYVANYTNVDKKGCFVSAGVLPKDTDLTGYYERTDGTSVDTYIYKAAEGKADGTTKYYKNYVTEEMFNQYKQGEARHVWTPDVSAGIASDGTKVPEFDDVAAGSWYENAVKFVASNGLFYGTSATKFSPDTTMTRAMTVTVLHRMAGTPAVSGTVDFEDVKAGSYYADAVQWAFDQKITSGTSEKAFSPDENVTREQFVTFAYNYYKAMGKDVSKTTSLDNFKDAGTISSFAVEPMKWAVANGIIYGVTADTINPKGTASRAEVAAILMRMN